MWKKRIYQLLLCLFPIVVSAQKADTLKTVEVQGQKNISPAKTYKIDKIQASSIYNYETNNLSQLLAKSSGLYIKNYGVGGLSTLSIRGAGAEKTKIYWNGIEINSPTLGQTDLAIVPVSFIDEVEVHYGSASVVDGSGGLGGAIQLNSHASYQSRSRISLTKELGSFGNDKTYLNAVIGTSKFQSKTAAFNLQANNDFTYIDRTQKELPEKKRVNASVFQRGVKQEFYFKPRVNHEVALKVNYLDSDRGVPTVLGVETKGERQIDNSVRVLGEWNTLLGNSFHHVRMAYLKDFLNYSDTVTNINSTVSTESYKGNYHFKYFFSDSLFVKLMFTGSKDVAISSGFSETKSQEKEAVYLHFEHQTKFRMLYNVACRQEIIGQIVTPIIPTAGVKYAFDSKEKWLINANASRNYKYPTLNELYWNPGGNPDLKPEIGYSGEVGMNYTSRNLQFGITPFYSKIDNWIQWLPGANGLWSPENVRKVENKGVELQASGKLIRKGSTQLHWKGSYQYLKSVTLESIVEGDNAKEKQLIYVPTNTFNIQVSAFIKQLEVNYSQTITGKVFIDSENTTYMPYYAPAFLSMSYKLRGKGKNKGWVGIKVNNLYNEEYQILANRPMPGRWFLVTFKIQLESADE